MSPTQTSPMESKLAKKYALQLQHLAEMYKVNTQLEKENNKNGKDNSVRSGRK